MTITAYSLDGIPFPLQAVQPEDIKRMAIGDQFSVPTPATDYKPAQSRVFSKLPDGSVCEIARHAHWEVKT